jgi:hypothetical protein
LTGYEQTRSVVAEIAGDYESADRVELVLPDSGVCGGSGLFEEAPTAGGCCGPSLTAAPELLTIGAPVAASVGAPLPLVQDEQPTVQTGCCG